MTVTASEIAGIIHDRLTDMHDQPQHFPGEPGDGVAIVNVSLVRASLDDIIEVDMSDGRIFQVTVEQVYR